MTTFRCRTLLIGLVLTAALNGCDPPASKTPADRAGKAPAGSLSAILEEPDSPKLSDSLSQFIEERESDPARLDRELRAAGFRRSDSNSGCARYAFTGEPEKLYFLDHTLHVLIERCGSRLQKQTISIKRGNA
jgi:hypothetical protein